MTKQNNNAAEKQISVDRDLLAKNGLYYKQMLLDTLDNFENVVVDLSSVDDCDSAGLQILLSLNRTAMLTNRSVRLRNVPSIVFDTTEKYGIDLGTIFAIE